MSCDDPAPLGPGRDPLDRFGIALWSLEVEGRADKILRVMPAGLVPDDLWERGAPLLPVRPPSRAESSGSSVGVNVMVRSWSVVAHRSSSNAPRRWSRGARECGTVVNEKGRCGAVAPRRSGDTDAHRGTGSSYPASRFRTSSRGRGQGTPHGDFP
ncbi:hypothetical protein Sliba_78050 [Streptomyces nigrescens]|uniref:Uncharacterized protein n=1 Tax=Streptomyces nigrescens TaxID=1920 RepID=A0A640TWV1_STRNI|nr:hypothetical protein Sliba_78050 [Streptomyces libani subsp. libani]GGV96380.1 hypothetical protein GCM10010500_39020 [Streptomyces libani subsp. libani]